MSHAHVKTYENQKGLVTSVCLVVLDVWEMPSLLRWSRRAKMTGGARSFFDCASGGDHRVFVAGGYDHDYVESALLIHQSVIHNSANAAVVAHVLNNRPDNPCY